MPNLLAPPIEWFTKPAELAPGLGMTLTDDGHVFGYLCLWNARFINGGRGNIRPPRGCDYAKWSNVFKTDATNSDGSKSEIRVGAIAGAGGHRFKDSFGSTQEAYADIETKFARVVYGEDSHGVWYSGAIMPHVTPEQVCNAKASGVSGHWEPPAPGAGKQLAASVLVNIPAFAQHANPHRIAASATITETDTGGFTVAPSFENAQVPKRGERVEYTAGPQVLAAAGDVQAPISGRLLSLNTETVDGRVIEEVEWTALPLPLFWADAQGYGHMGSTVVGRIDAITVVGDDVTFTGVLDAAFMQAHGAKDVADLGVLGISIDGAATGDVVPEFDDDSDGWWPDRIRFLMMQILGATLTSVPAFHGTLGVDAGDFTDVSSESSDGEDVPVEDDSDVEVPVEEAAGGITIKLQHVDGERGTKIVAPVVWGE